MFGGMIQSLQDSRRIILVSPITQVVIDGGLTCFAGDGVQEWSLENTRVRLSFWDCETKGPYSLPGVVVAEIISARFPGWVTRLLPAKFETKNFDFEVTWYESWLSTGLANPTYGYSSEYPRIKWQRRAVVTDLSKDPAEQDRQLLEASTLRPYYCIAPPPETDQSDRPILTEKVLSLVGGGLQCGHFEFQFDWRAEHCYPQMTLAEALKK